MAETYIITAKTVAEAVALAKREYEDADHEISYEIVKMEKKGLFGLLGARDAQIKVTVSKVVSVQSELGSLVADIKNLKSVTDRGSSGTPAPAPAQEKPQPQQQQKQQKQNQNQNQQKQQNQNQKQNQPKQQQQQNQPKADKQQQNNPQPKQQQNQQKQQQNQPKAEKQQQNNQPKQQNQQQKQQNNQPKQQNNNQQKQQQNQPKAEKPAEKPIEAPVTAEPAEKAAETPYRSALGNQATPRKRNRQKKAAPAEEDLSAAVTVSAPVGLTDFVSEGNESGFGSGANKSAGSSGGRMNNDIRKKNRNQKPAAADKPTEKPAEESLSTTVVPASEVPSRSRRSRGRGRGPVQRTDSDAMASRYDMAESDEDYEKLNALVAEAESVFEAKKAEAEPVREERRREAITEAEMNYALDFVNTLLGNMHLDAHAVPAECPEGEEFDVTEEATVYPKIDIVGEETGILIGHHGETLDSIQYLANLCALRRTKSRDGDYVKIVVDIENYRQKREDTLRTLARRMAARAVKYRRNVFLEPMNAYERRIIHSELQSYDGVSTHSVGTDRDRKIIVTYEGPDKQPDRRRGEEKPAAEQQSQQSGQGKKRSRGRRGGDRSASGNNAQTESAAAVTVSAETAEPKESRERRRPKKQQKMSIEELTDWLPDAGEATGEIDDTLNVMSGLRSRVSDDLNDAADAAEAEAIEVDEVVEETAEAAAKAEEAVREAEAKFEAKAAALLETLGALADGKDDE